VLTSRAAIATFFFVSLYLQRVLGPRPFSGGLALLPFPAGIVGGAMIARKAVPKFGSRAVAHVGIAIDFVGLLVYREFQSAVTTRRTCLLACCH